MNTTISAEHLTDKGNLKATVLAGIKENAVALIVDALPLEATPNGTFAMVLPSEEGTGPFYLTVSVTVGKADPFIKAEKKVKEKEVIAIDIPSLFGSAE